MARVVSGYLTPLPPALYTVTMRYGDGSNMPVGHRLTQRRAFRQLAEAEEVLVTEVLEHSQYQTDFEDWLYEGSGGLKRRCECNNCSVSVRGRGRSKKTSQASLTPFPLALLHQVWIIDHPNALAEPPTDDDLISALLRKTPGALDFFCVQSWGEWERKPSGLLRWGQFWEPGLGGVEVEIRRMDIGALDDVASVLSRRDCRHCTSLNHPLTPSPAVM